MSTFLKKHGPDFAQHIINLNWSIKEKNIQLEFQINKRLGSGWNVDPLFSSDWSKNWGLWNKDVFEAFFQLRQDPTDVKAPYLEIQVSPLNQPFALIITEPRQTFFAPNTLHYKSEVEAKDKLWEGKIELSLPDELKGNLLYGSFFSCLSQDPREYYALVPNPETTADFHRPELFLKLDN